MANNLQETMTIVDPEFYEDDEDILGGEGAGLFPEDLNNPDEDDDSGINYTPELISSEDLDKLPAPTPQPAHEEDIIAALLRNKGISNMHEISFQDENGVETEKQRSRPA